MSFYLGEDGFKSTRALHGWGLQDLP